MDKKVRSLVDLSESQKEKILMEKKVRSLVDLSECQKVGSSVDLSKSQKGTLKLQIADEHISTVLAQLRRIIADTSFRRLKDVIKSLDRCLGAFQSMVLDRGNGLFSVQLLERGIDVHALDEVLYDIEDAISGVLHLGVSTELAAAGLKKFETKSAALEKLLTKRRVPLTLFTSLERLGELMSVLTSIPHGSYPLHSKRSFFVKLSKLYGLDVVKKDIINVILGESFRDSSDNIKTIFIVGMEGTGKTYLAQCICTDYHVLEIFDNIIWVNVSDDFDLAKIARKIIQSLEGLEHDALCLLTLVPLQSLLDRIRRKIVNKKSLLVLDGVGRYDFDDWEALRAVFQHGSLESGILVTTHEHLVAGGMESSYIFRLGKLSDELCWMILREVGLNDDILEYAVEDIGRELARRCEGLPFAAKVLGDAIRHNDFGIRRWDVFLRYSIWESARIPKYNNVLSLSYCNLPLSIRRCLLYWAIFPKNFEISKTLLVQHWMAQGYLYSSDNLKMELKGEEYIRCLEAHSFFQYCSRDGGIFTCKMHGIVHDFVKSLFQYEVMMEIKSVKQLPLNLSSQRLVEVKFVETSVPGSLFRVPSSIFPRTHHLILRIAQGAGFPRFIIGAKKLRTLIVVSQGCLITGQALSNLFKQSKHLRLLDLSLTSGWHNCFGPSGQGNILDEIPEEICRLINLRYLSLAGSKVLKILPETLCDLHNLQSLDLTGCSSLKKLPDGMGKLMNLRYLCTWLCSSIASYPKGISCLTSLRELTNVIASADHNDAKQFSLGDFEKLNHLCGQVRVKLVGNAIDADEALRANLWNKKDLDCIRINLDGDIGKESQDVIKKALNPPSNLNIEFVGRLVVFIGGGVVSYKEVAWF
ncbi:Disease resistance protein [Gossypium australe]|uniref:Disease resistance protein n=1 Tax=Gossypium australe TaxID=47621 RepID=A0A5B6VT58_9ROSI|nr:Disease resistance protein [Gossypium australe]